MKIEVHPYGQFIPPNPRCMIIGSFPIGKFTDPERRGEIKPHEFDFFFGGEKNLLWKLIGDCYGVKLDSKEKIVNLLTEKRIAIGDVIHSCGRKNGSASDADLVDITWNTELASIIKRNKIDQLFFTSKQVMKWFHKIFPDFNGPSEIILYSPSAQSARSIARLTEYAEWKIDNENAKTYFFILENYKRYFF